MLILHHFLYLKIKNTNVIVYQKENLHYNYLSYFFTQDKVITLNVFLI